MNKDNNNLNNSISPDLKFNSIVVAGIVRNCGEFIIGDIERLKTALQDFDYLQYLIIESDSTDNTLEKLEYLKNTIQNFHFISLGALRTSIPKRTERLAFCRNKYLEEIENNKLFQNAGYILISDLDGTNELLTKENIASCMEINDWDVCTANQKGPYYDIWALRHPHLSPNDCWKAYHYMVNELGFKPELARKKALKSRMYWFHKSARPFEVDSAFGGLAIYKRHILNNIRYIGVDENGSEICEHVALNRQIKEKGGKIYLNPKLINCYPPMQYVKSRPKKILLTLQRYYYNIVED
jgi:hypothetical protein